MKISSFNPMILSRDAEAIKHFFEDLGFEKKHAPTVDTGKSKVTCTRMKEANGFAVDVADVNSMARDMTIIRMNVDNFEEAYEMLLAKGFTNPRGDGKLETEHNKSAMMISPWGFAFDLCQHIKE